MLNQTAQPSVSRIPAGGEPQLPDNIIHQNDVNASGSSSVDPFSLSRRKWIQDVYYAVVSSEAIRQRRSWLKIEKVPAMLREVKANSGSYDPLVVSVGPYHHGKFELEFMEKHKLKMASQYVHGDLRMLENLYQGVSHLATDARECYADKEAVAKFTDEKFVQMMVLDACFILHFINCIVNNTPGDLEMKSNMIPVVQRDLLLLENQIPFQVLRTMGARMDMLYKFVALCNLSPPEDYEAARDRNQSAHLLDYFRSHLFDQSPRTRNLQREGNDSYWFSFRSAKELKAVGIHFRPSQTNKFTDVDFQSKYYCKSFLKLPQICIHDSTKSILLNMVAHESSTDGPDDLGVSSYICFMDSLIDHAEDVMELRKKGIILNFLGSDQQVADLFNELSSNLVPHPRAYAEVKGKIEEHYKNRKKIWLAEWLHDHFTSPWTVLAFIGAILALSLSVIQTYESIKSSKSQSTSKS